MFMNPGASFGGYQKEMDCGCGSGGFTQRGWGGNSFAMILVLFILLVIIGCTCFNQGEVCC